MKIRLRKQYGPLPDFRQIPVLLWGDETDYDSDGNAQFPADRNWTELYVSRRNSTDSPIEIYPDGEWLVIESDDRHATLAVAVFLMEWSEMHWEETAGVTYTQARDEVVEQYDFLTKWERAEQSYWKTATRENPYPVRDT